MKMMFFAGLILSQLLGNVFAAGVEDEKQIDLITASAVYYDLFSKVVPVFEKETGIKVNYTKDPNIVSSAPITMKAVLDGEAEAGVASISFADWTEVVHKQFHIPVAEFSKLTSRVIGKDMIRVIAHLKVGVKTLTLEQVSGIFSGKIKNWKEVGGSDTPITVVVQDKAVARTTVFKKVAMKGAEFTAAQKVAKNADELKAILASQPGSVSYFPENQIEKQDKMVTLETSEEIGRPITMITRGKPKPEVFRFIDFIAKESRRILAAAKKE